MSVIDVPVVDDFAHATTPIEKFKAIVMSLTAVAKTYDNMVLHADPPLSDDDAQDAIDKAGAIRQKAQLADEEGIAAAIGGAGDWDKIHTATEQLTNDLKKLVQQQQNFAGAIALGDRVLNGFTAFSTFDVPGIVTALTAS